MDGAIVLTLLTFSPLIGVLFLLFVDRRNKRRLKAIGMMATLIPLIGALALYAAFQTGQEGVQFEEQVNWITFTVFGSMGQPVEFPITYSMGVDGLSMPLIVMTAIVTTLAAVASMYIKRNWKSYFIWLLTLEVGLLGVFAARDLFLFFIFFEIVLVATFLLIGKWGYVHREQAANQFLIYNGIGSGVMLLAFISIWFIFGTMQYDELTERALQLTGQLSAMPEMNWLVLGTFIAILVSFGIKLPFFPFHTWMLKVHVEAPPPVVMLHSGVMLKMGAYGLIRFGVELFPGYVTDLAFFIGVLGVVNILYGALLAFVQTDLKRVIAYSSISHMGIILLGIAALNVTGLQGAVFQMVSHGFISALLFFFIAALTERTGTTLLPELGGLAKSAPVLCGIFLAAGMATLGLPGMSGFISEFLAFLGIFETRPVLGVLGVLGMILAALYMLRAVLGTTFGPAKGRWPSLKDTRPVEAVPMLVLLGFIVLIGVYPAVLNDPLHVTLESIVARMGG